MALTSANPNTTGWSRRRLIQAGGVIGAAGLGGLTACSTDAPAGPGGSSTPPRTGSSTATSALPDYIPYDGPTPDLPGDGGPVMDAYTSYPADPQPYSTTTPGSGGTVTASTRTLGPAVIPADRNPYWQGINERLGVELKIDSVPSDDYSARFSTMITGNDLPDFVQIFLTTPRLSEVLEARFENLSPYLSGSEISNYPALANLPSYAWQKAIHNGQVMAVPYAQQTTGSPLFGRPDLMAEKGLAEKPANGEEFLETLRALTEPKANRWALGLGVGNLVTFFAQMVGAPNQWRLDGDQLVSQWETDEYAKALELAASVVEEGLIHPDFATTSSTNFINALGAGQIAFTTNAYTLWSVFATRYGGSFPGVSLYGMELPQWDGGGIANHHAGGGVYTITAISKQDDPERVRELLRIMDFLAAPYGTQEHHYIKYGQEGVHHELEDGEPVFTSAGTDQIQVPVQYLGNAAPVTFATEDGVAAAMHDYQTKVGPGQVSNPADGVWTPAVEKDLVRVNTTIGDMVGEIVQGRRTMTDWPAAVDEWKASGGDTIRDELSEAIAAA